MFWFKAESAGSGGPAEMTKTLSPGSYAEADFYFFRLRKFWNKVTQQTTRLLIASHTARTAESAESGESLFSTGIAVQKLVEEHEALEWPEIME